MSDWTKEPWPEQLSCMSPQFLSILDTDYARARTCVNALAGRVPEKLAALEEAIDELVSHDPATDWPFFQNAWDDLKGALAAFRGEKT